MARADPLARINSSKGGLEVSELIECGVGKAWLAPGYVAAERSRESASFSDEVPGVDPKPKFALNRFGDSGDGEERRVAASSQDSEDGSGVNSGILREPRGSLEAVPFGMGEHIRKSRDGLVKVVG